MMSRFACSLCVLLACVAAPSLFAQDVQFEGELDNRDAMLQETGEWMDSFEIELKAGQLLDLSMVSEEIDSYLLVVAPDGETFENDDWDVDENVDARLLMLAPKTGVYEIVATSANPEEEGAYTIEGVILQTKSTKKELGSLTAEDEVSWKGGEYYDLVELEIPAGQRRLVSISVAGFDAFLSAHDADGQSLFADDPATLILEGGESGQSYTVVITSYDARETGDYVLDIREVFEEL